MDGGEGRSFVYYCYFMSFYIAFTVFYYNIVSCLEAAVLAARGRDKNQSINHSYGEFVKQRYEKETAIPASKFCHKPVVVGN